MPFVAFRNPLLSAFCCIFQSVFECDSHHSESDEDESLSVPELELPVELPIVFDFCSCGCLIIINIFCLFVRLQKYAGYFKVTPQVTGEV